jgi:trk system potassium uptake protein TrkH
MHYRFILRQLGLLLMVLGGSMVLILGIELLGMASKTREILAVWALVIGIAVNFALGSLLWIAGAGGKGSIDVMSRRDSMLLVAVSWLLGAATAAVPFYAWAAMGGGGEDHPFANPVNCYFESMSGLTTTGATILPEIQTVPMGLLLWRAALQWLGGLGIVVLFVAVLPMVGGGKRLFHTEAPGPTQQGVRPRIRDTARLLWIIYLGFTVLCAVGYMLTGMDWFDAICHSFTTVATGGFSTKDASLGAYDHPGADVVAIVFMILCGVNFGLYFGLMSGKWRPVLRDPELRLYLMIIGGATLIMAGTLVGHTIITTSGEQLDDVSFFVAVEYALFQAAAIITTTGYATADFDLWPFLAEAVLVGLMFVGGCAGSTGGGIKVIRILIVFKIIISEIERQFRPSVVRTLRVGGGVVDENLRRSVLNYVVTVVIIFGVGSVTLAVIEGPDVLDYTGAATATVSTFMNIGPGLHNVGPVRNYEFFTDASKLIMSLLMALGRLELYALLVLLYPRFWRND